MNCQLAFGQVPLRCSAPTEIMDSMLPHVSALLRDLAAKECLKSGFRVNSVKEGGESGFHGKTQAVELDDGTKSLPLFLKLCPTDPLTRELQKTHAKFLNEVTFYRDIAGKLKDYGQIPRIPKYYGSCCETLKEAILLEDLRKEGYKVKPLSEGLDSKHLDLVAKSLAKLHHASVKWKNHDPENFQKTVTALKETIFCRRTDPNDQQLTKLLFVQACEMGLKCATPGDRDSCSKYVNYSMINHLDNLETWTRPDNAEHNVILHGDSWCHNFLFKYNENNEPTEVALIDWQMLKVGSPAMDLLECFLSSADADAMNAPSDFLESYALEADLGINQLRRDFPKWGAPALLLVLAITVNFAEKDSLSDKFNKALEEGKYKNQLSELTQSRIRMIMHAAREIGIFAK